MGPLNSAAVRPCVCLLWSLLVCLVPNSWGAFYGNVGSLYSEYKQETNFASCTTTLTSGWTVGSTSTSCMGFPIISAVKPGASDFIGRHGFVLLCCSLTLLTGKWDWRCRHYKVGIFTLISSQEMGMNIVGIPLVKSTHYDYYKKYLWPPEVAKWQCSHCMHHKNDIFNNARWGTRPQLLFL